MKNIGQSILAAVFILTLAVVLSAPPAFASEEAVPVYKPLPLFVANLAGPDRHYLRLQITLECESPAVEQEVDTRMPQIRDAILMCLCNLEYEEALTDTGKKRLQQEILHQTNKFLTTGRVSNAYFTDFVTQ